jgi:hypothetical protein
VESVGYFKVTFSKIIEMKEQNFKNHARLVPLFHGLTALLVFTGFIGAIVNCFRAYHNGGGRLAAVLLFLLFVIGGLFFWFIRSFALGAQDRAIRAEENLRYFSITRKLLDSRLSLKQIIALRFAHDDEFIALADRAVTEHLKPKEIKEAIQQWKADHNRI